MPPAALILPGGINVVYRCRVSSSLSTMGRAKFQNNDGTPKMGKAAPFHTAGISKNPTDPGAVKHPKGRVKKEPKKRVTIVTEDLVVPKTRKPTRFKNSTIALRDIKKQQKSTDTIIPRMVIRRIIRDMLNDPMVVGVGKSYRIQVAGVTEVVEYVDHFASLVFNEANNEAIKAGRTTVQPEDIREVKRLHIDCNSFERAPRSIPFETKKDDNAALKIRKEASEAANRVWRGMDKDERKANQAIVMAVELPAESMSAAQTKRSVVAPAIVAPMEDDGYTDEDDDYVECTEEPEPAEASGDEASGVEEA